MRLLGRIALASTVALAAVLVSSVPASADKDQVPAAFPDSKVEKRTVRELEAYWIPVGKLFGDGQAEKFEVVEGKWTHLDYSLPPKRSVIEIARYYDQGLREAGYEVVYACRDGDCGQGGRKTNGDWWDPNHLRRYLVGRLARPEGDLWVCVHVQAKVANAPARLEVDLLEAKPEPVVEKVEPDETDAGWLEQELIEHGHVALRGVTFDPKRLAPTPDSRPLLEAISQLLARDPRRSLLVVVHSDGAGDMAANLQRSRKQAIALVSTLVKQFGVAPKRLRGDGVGPLAPVASNATDEGRARNRRIELVLVGVPEPNLKASQGD